MTRCRFRSGQKRKNVGAWNRRTRAVATRKKSGPADLLRIDAEREEAQGGLAMHSHDRRFNEGRQRVFWGAFALSLTAIVGPLGAGTVRGKPSFSARPVRI